MPEPNLIRTLTTKQMAIELAIRGYEKQIDLCRRDLAHINAPLVVFASPERRTQFPVYMDTLRLFYASGDIDALESGVAAEGH